MIITMMMLKRSAIFCLSVPNAKQSVSFTDMLSTVDIYSTILKNILLFNVLDANHAEARMRFSLISSFLIATFLHLLFFGFLIFIKKNICQFHKLLVLLAFLIRPLKHLSTVINSIMRNV